MKYTLRHLGGLGRSVRRFLQPSAAERPNLHQAGLLRRLVAAPMPNSNAAGADEEMAVAFFAKALQRAGFLSAEEAPGAVAEYAAHKPAWRAALLQEALSVCQVGLPVYATMAGPLMGGLDWSALPAGAHNDRLYTLRPHRFGFLPRLAIAASLGADTLPAILATLERWITHTDKGGGAADAYFSNLVVIYRLLATSWAVPFITSKARSGDRTAATICVRLFQILAADIQHLQPRFGQSAANNHLLADRFAAWLVATCYPELCPRSSPREFEHTWLGELSRQFQADGTNFEQSLHYHELGCEMALVYLVISLRIGASVPVPALSLIAHMLRFQVALADERGNSFALGDATDDPLLPLDATASWACGAWRIFYRTLFDPSFPATDDAARGAERAFWLQVAIRNVARPLHLPERPAQLGNLAAFPVNGYVVFRDDAGLQRVLFRTGPRPSTKVSPGHAMSDLLTVYWNVCGRPLLEPAGTYAYAASRAGNHDGPVDARSYFRGPAAHNGLVLRGHDPLGETAGRFREADNGTRVATRWRSLDGILDWAEGQLEERGPLNGHRRGVLCVAGRYAIVYDHLPALPNDADIACHWQFAPEADVTLLQDRQATIALDDCTAYLCASDGLAALDAVRGCGDPPAGWVSRRYGEITPASQLICRLEAGARKLGFVFGLAGEDKSPPRLQILDTGEASIIVEVRRGQCCDLVVIGGYAGSLAGQSCNIDVRGQILWLGLEGNRCIEMRALGLQHLSSEALGLEMAVGRSTAMQGNWSTVACEESISGLSGQWRRTTRD